MACVFSECLSVHGVAFVSLLAFPQKVLWLAHSAMHAGLMHVI